MVKSKDSKVMYLKFITSYCFRRATTFVVCKLYDDVPDEKNDYNSLSRQMGSKDPVSNSTVLVFPELIHRVGSINIDIPRGAF